MCAADRTHSISQMEGKKMRMRNGVILERRRYTATREESRTSITQVEQGFL